MKKMRSKIKVLIYDIKWDTDGEKVKLPKKVEHIFDGYNDINDDDLLDEIADWLTDEYGYCHDGFDVKEISEDKDGADLECLPMWNIQFENGDTMAAYPEEICLAERKA